MPAPLAIPLGAVFGRLIVESEATSLGRYRAFNVRCVCGIRAVVRLENLRSGRTRSCGCLHREELAARATTHGHTKGGKATPEFIAWCDMRRRCEDPTREGYENYGGRGIVVCERWRDFEAFIADVGLRPDPTLSLDRIDNDGNYQPGNVRWTDRSTQNSNQRHGIRKRKANDRG